MNSRLRMQVYRIAHLLHWISAAVCSSALALFTVTGITLNHSGSIGGKAVVTTRAALAPGAARDGTVPSGLAEWLDREFGMPVGDASAEWSDDELYLSAPGPGRDAWVSINLSSGAAKAESTDRGWLAYFNDLTRAATPGSGGACSSTSSRLSSRRWMRASQRRVTIADSSNRAAGTIRTSSIRRPASR